MASICRCTCSSRAATVCSSSPIFRQLNNEEATRILGATLPIVQDRKGIYAETETNRLAACSRSCSASSATRGRRSLRAKTNPCNSPAFTNFRANSAKSTRRWYASWWSCAAQPVHRGTVPARLLFLRRPAHHGERSGARRPHRRPAVAGGRVGATGMFRAKAGGAAGAAANAS